MRNGPRVLALLAAVAVVAAACGRAEEAPAGGGTQGPEVISEIGPTRGSCR